MTLQKPITCLYNVEHDIFYVLFMPFFANFYLGEFNLIHNKSCWINEKCLHQNNFNSQENLIPFLIDAFKKEWEWLELLDGSFI